MPTELSSVSLSGGRLVTLSDDGAAGDARIARSTSVTSARVTRERSRSAMVDLALPEAEAAVEDRGRRRGPRGRRAHDDRRGRARDRRRRDHLDDEPAD